jgi:hypothetical protein
MSCNKHDLETQREEYKSFTQKEYDILKTPVKQNSESLIICGERLASILDKAIKK